MWSNENDCNFVKMIIMIIVNTITKMKRILTFSVLMMAVALMSAAVYEPSLSSDSEVCVFFEADGTVTDSPKIWV